MDNEMIFVSGQRGSGKSYWIRHKTTELSRFLLFDTLSEYQGCAPSFDDLTELIEHCQKAGDGFLEALFDDPSEDPKETFPLFCEIGQEIGNLYVIVEEIDIFATPYDVPEELNRLIKYGRHRGVNLIAVSRRPAEVSRLITSQATRFIIFRQFEPRDISYFRSIIGPYADALPSLGIHEFYDIDFSEGPILERPKVQKLSGPHE